MNDMEIVEKVFANIGSPPAVEAYCKASVLEAIRLTRIDCAEALARKARLPDDPRESGIR